MRWCVCVVNVNTARHHIVTAMHSPCALCAHTHLVVAVRVADLALEVVAVLQLVRADTVPERPLGVGVDVHLDAGRGGAGCWNEVSYDGMESKDEGDDTALDTLQYLTWLRGTGKRYYKYENTRKHSRD